MEKRYLPEDEETADKDPRFVEMSRQIIRGLLNIDDLDEEELEILDLGCKARRERANREQVEKEKAAAVVAKVMAGPPVSEIHVGSAVSKTQTCMVGAGAAPTFTLVVKDGAPGVDLRELHRELESKRQFGNWAEANLSQFVKGEDYTSFNNIVKREKGASVRKDYVVSIECAKHIAMMENTERGKQVRQYFIECEKALRVKEVAESGVRPVTTLRESLVLSLELLDRNEALTLVNTEQANLIEQLAPKVEFFDPSISVLRDHRPKNTVSEN